MQPRRQHLELREKGLFASRRKKGGKLVRRRHRRRCCSLYLFLVNECEYFDKFAKALTCSPSYEH